MYAIAPAQKNQVCWVEQVREPFLTPSTLKASVVGTEGDLLKLDRVTKPVDRSQVFEIDENKWADIQKARIEFGDALEELERLVKTCQCIAKVPNKSFVDSWAIALKHQINQRVELDPWEVLFIKAGKIISHSSNQVKLIDLNEKNFRCCDLQRVFILKSFSDWKLIESQIELCEKMGEQFKAALEAEVKEFQNVLEFKKPESSVLTVIAQPEIEASNVIEGEIVETSSRTEEEQRFYASLDPKVRHWLINDAEPMIFELEYEQAEFEQQAIDCEIRRGQLLLEVRKRLGDRDGSWSKWLGLYYQEQVRSKSLKSAMERARTSMRLAESEDFTALPSEIRKKFDPSAAKLLIKPENEGARRQAIAIAKDPETKILSFSRAKELVWEQDPTTPKPGKKRKEKLETTRINHLNTLNPPPIGEEEQEIEERYPITDLKEIIKNGGTDEEIEQVLDAIVHEKVTEALADEGRRIHWEEIAKKEAEEEVSQKLEQYSEAIAQLAKAKSQNIQLQQKAEELEAKLSQVNETQIVKENQELRRKVDEYAIASQAKKQTQIKYHHYEELGKNIGDRDTLEMFQDLLTQLKSVEEELLILSASADENSPPSKPDGDVMSAEEKPQEIAIGV